MSHAWRKTWSKPSGAKRARQKAEDNGQTHYNSSGRDSNPDDNKSADNHDNPKGSKGD